jgi:DNA-directed RNA polymerase subunit alpha
VGTAGDWMESIMTTRFRWRGLELPTHVQPDARFNSDVYGRFTIEPFERGFGTTVGNSLRRVLLSSLEGAAVTSIKIKGATHEFSSLPGVMEDVTDIVLNVKNLIVKLEGDEPKTMRLAARGPGEITADMIEADTAVTILNKELVLATLTDKIDFEMELRVAKGRGYVPASEQYNEQEDQEIGLIHVDALYSPVQRVRYKIEETRVGQRTNYDKLTLEIWTNGTVEPEMALVEAAKILRKHLNPFVQYFDMGSERVSDEAAAAAGVDEDLIRKLNMSVGELELSVRASNCLESARIETVAQLATQSEADLLKLRSFGRTSLREVKRKLLDIGLDLGMKLPEGVTIVKPQIPA